MSEEKKETTEAVTETATEETAKPVASSKEIKLDGLFAEKLGMSSVYGEKGELIPVTVLKMNKWFVTQIKTTEKEGYDAVQVSKVERREDKSSKASLGHVKKAKLEKGINASREIRQTPPEGVTVGQQVSFETFAKGDQVQISSKSKGHGFAGVLKRWNFAGGPAAHGSTFHRQPGSVGNRTWPGRIMPGKKLPGHYGDETISVKNVQVVEVIPEDQILMVKGPVPGGRNTLVKLMRQ